MVADYIVNELDRQLMGYFARRDGKPSTSPAVGIYGPKVMIINESAGSGGDALPYYFKQQKDRPARGDAHVGRAGRHAADSGDDRRRRHHGTVAGVLRSATASGRSKTKAWRRTSRWKTHRPTSIAGNDPQLERAVQEAMKLLEQQPGPRVPRPAPIDRVTPPIRDHRSADRNES